jgi:hypothetical protein
LFYYIHFQSFNF